MGKLEYGGSFSTYLYYWIQLVICFPFALEMKHRYWDWDLAYKCDVYLWQISFIVIKKWYAYKLNWLTTTHKLKYDSNSNGPIPIQYVEKLVAIAQRNYYTDDLNIRNQLLNDIDFLFVLSKKTKKNLNGVKSPQAMRKWFKRRIRAKYTFVYE